MKGRQMVEESRRSSPKADWYPDPVGRHQYRYWDGSAWTAHAADSGKTSVDPLDVKAPSDQGDATAVNVDSLLSDIVEHVDIVIGDTSQDERVAQLLSLGPSVVPNIDAAINRVVVTQGGHSTHQYENAGRLCEVIGELGGPSAFTILSRYADQDSNIWEYSHIREGARKGLGLLPQATQATPATPATPATKDEHSPSRGGQPRTQPSQPAKPLATSAMERAREIVGEKNFFGPSEWDQYCGSEFHFTDVPEIPWTESKLRNRGIDQPHFLFLGISNTEGMSLDVPWLSVRPTPAFEEILNWYLDQARRSADGTYETRWYQMPIGDVKGLWNLTYSEQSSRLPAGYEIPTAAERFGANILFHLLNGDYLDNYLHDARTRTNRDGLYTLIRIDDEGSTPTLVMRKGSDAAVSNFGIAASRKIPSLPVGH